VQEQGPRVRPGEEKSRAAKPIWAAKRILRAATGPGRRGSLCRGILLVDRSTTEEISTVSERALEQQKQNHLRPCSRRLTAEEEKKTGAQTGVKQEQQILLHTPAARFLISGEGNEVLTSGQGARKDFATAQTNWHRSRNLDTVS
jgi:hypothetical protein